MQIGRCVTGIRSMMKINVKLLLGRKGPRPVSYPEDHALTFVKILRDNFKIFGKLVYKPVIFSQCDTGK